MDTSMRRIVREFLRENRYDGLVSPGNCSCMPEDLIPCGEPNGYCVAGHLIRSEECKHCNSQTICISANKHVATCPDQNKGEV